MTYAITDMLAVRAIFISHASYSDISFMCNIYIPGFKGNINKNKEKEIYCPSVTDYCSVF